MSIKLGIKRRARRLFGSRPTRAPAGVPLGAAWAEVVEVIYRAALGREVDASGLATYTAAMSSGRMSPRDVLEALYRSDEGRLAFANKTTHVLIPALYEGLLRRAPTIEEINQWDQRLLNGASLGDIVREIVDMPEGWRLQLNNILQHQGMQALFLAEYRQRGTIDG